MIASLAALATKIRSVLRTGPRHYDIDSAALARVLRAGFYGPTPKEKPDCDVCLKNEAPISTGTKNYCADCWSLVEKRTAPRYLRIVWTHAENGVATEKYVLSDHP